MLFLTLFVAVSVVIGVYYLRRYAGTEQMPRPRAAARIEVRSGATPSGRRRRRHYYGATLKPAPVSCDAARGLEGRRYLADQAPELPLANCDVDRCKCRMLPLDDRRAACDRRDRFVAYGDFDAEFNREQRSNGDRRKT